MAGDVVGSNRSDTSASPASGSPRLSSELTDRALTPTRSRPRDASRRRREDGARQNQRGARYTYLKLAREQVLVAFSLAELADRLGDRAFRAHRSHLVNLDHVEALAPRLRGQLVLVIRDHDRNRILGL